MKKVILFGTSRLGEIAYNILKDKYDICFFSDNDEDKWEKEFCNKRIIPPHYLTNYIECHVIIASMYYIAISNQLKELGLNNLYIFSYCDFSDKIYNKRYEISKIGNSENYNDLHIDEEFKNQFLNNFNCLYENSSKEILEKKWQQEKNILIFAYIFPPIAGAGVQRTLKYVKYLSELGFSPTVVTVGKDFIEEEKDYNLLNEISNDIKIIRIDHLKVNSEQLTKKELKQILNLISGVVNNKELISNFMDLLREDRSYISIPDNKIFWVNDVLKNIEKLVDLKSFKSIYTTSSPYATHIIGYYIKNKYKNIKWIADFRDEWSNNPYINNKESLKYKLEYQMEKEILNTADKVIQVTPLSTENCKRIFNLNGNKVATITNGYDELDFKNINESKIKNNQKFVLIYSGTVYKNRLPNNLFFAINELIEENIINRQQIEIKFYGKYLDNTRQTIAKYDKFNIVSYNGYLSHKRCISENNRSDLLLLPIGEGDSFRQVYPGKVFEYMRLQIPILALAPTNGVVSQLLKETKTGETFEYSDLQGIKSFISKNYIMWCNNEKYSEVNINEIQKYERKELTKKLINIIEEA